MRILNLIPNLSGGGAERQLSYLAPELANRGHDVHIAYLHNSAISPFEDNSVHLHQLRSSSNYDPRILFQTYHLIKDIRPDLVQSWILQSDMFAAFSVKFCKTLWVIRESNSPSLRPDKKMKFWIRKQAARFSNAIAANSRSGMTYWKNIYPAKLICMIRNGFPIDEILCCQNVHHDLLAKNKQERYILFIGRFDPQKNVETLLLAMRNIPPNIKLILCGHGQLENQYRRQIISLRLEDRIILRGYLEKKEVWALMREVSATILVSHHEGFPNVLIEAMINRCPLIVGDIPPHREFLDETTACFVNKQDPHNIGEGIIKTLTHSQETITRAENAFQVAQQFSIKKMADEYESLYNRLLSRGPETEFSHMSLSR